MQNSKCYRSTHDFWSYNDDGRFDQERIKGKDKQILKKKRRLYEKKEMINELEKYR